MDGAAMGLVFLVTAPSSVTISLPFVFGRHGMVLILSTAHWDGTG
jgi:hypothetical protein